MGPARGKASHQGPRPATMTASTTSPFGPGRLRRARHAARRLAAGACELAAGPFALAARRPGLRALAFGALVAPAAGAQHRAPLDAGDGPNGVWTSLEA